MLCGAFHDTAKNLPEHCQQLLGVQWCGHPRKLLAHILQSGGHADSVYCVSCLGPSYTIPHLLREPLSAEVHDRGASVALARLFG